MRTRSLVGTFAGLALPLGVIAQPAAAKRYENLAVSSITPTGATVEASINTEGEETGYEVLSSTKSCTVRPNDTQECEWKKTVVASGTLPASAEPQAISVPETLEEQKGYFAWVVTTNEAGRVEDATWFETPGEVGTGKPWIENLALTNLTSSSATLEVTYDLEASRGFYVLWVQGAPSHRFKKKLRAGTGTFVTTVKVKPFHRYQVYFTLASAEGVREQEISFTPPTP